jgi:para-aminobenzoate synthetase component 2
MARILVVDNYDSFVFNLVQYLAQLGADVEVRRNDAIDATDPLFAEVDGVLLSPGPGRPEDAGCCIDVIKAHGAAKPIFGVCLGHQAIGVAYGGTVDRAPELLHGKTSEVEHDGKGVFAEVPNPCIATRYHSLTVLEPDLPAVLEVSARTAGGVIMGVPTASTRSKASSSTLSRCSPKAVTACWPTGSRCVGIPPPEHACPSLPRSWNASAPRSPKTPPAGAGAGNRDSCRCGGPP